jgi:transcriptional regulator with GAF, ATPase, and Fis domain/pSer/pThr/pTyr-binding forkhead associated (FHA) protein
LLNPRLVALSGPLEGTIRVLTDGPLSLGRDTTNQIMIGDSAVSRNHCTITSVSPEVYEIFDLESHNGTFVNGIQISRAPIRHGDRIRVGSSEFAFFTREDEGTGSGQSSDIGKQTTSGTVTALLLDKRSGLPVNPSGIGRMARDLSAFFKIANLVNSFHDVDTLQRELLALIFEVVPAQQGAILLQSNASEESPPCTWSRHGEVKPQMVIREEFAQRAMWERSAIFATVPSASAPEEHVLCLPLLGVENILGVIYLTSPAISPPFGEDQLSFLSSVSRIAAVSLENLLKLDSLQAENQRLRADMEADTMLGDSPAMSRVTEFIRRVAQGDSTVLLRGESGTGKELAARAIHANSSRSSKPFVAINCAAIPETLLESELFGHEKGAFTGAAAAKKGKFETAEDGTLLLDEIGEMAPLLQAKLLRVLQQREFERLGGTRLLPFNARVLAATNKNLEQAIKAGEFRQDLYYRLNVVSVTVPPLRERCEDIPVLALHFANRLAAKSKRGFKGISAEARSLLMGYSWPGNIRELENAIEHAIVLGLTDEILPEDLPEALLQEQSSGMTAALYHNTLNQTKKQLVITAMDDAKGNHVEAARLLGIHPKYLHRLIKNLNLKSDVMRLKQ